MKTQLTRRELFVRKATELAGVVSIGRPVLAGARREANTGRPVDSYALDVGYSQRTLAGYPISTRTYNASFPGPMFVTRPGHILRVRLTNNLPLQKAVEPPPGIDAENNPHDFNTTALHFHGLQVVPHLFSPIGTSDPAARMVAVKCGQSLTYNFELPDDHPAGLYWYHPHRHGSATVQVAGGMAGLILVKGAVDEVPEIAAARDLVLAIQNPKVNPDQRGTGVWGWEPQPFKSPEQGGFSFQTQLEFLTANGKPIMVIDRRAKIPKVSQLALPGYHLRPGEVIRLRVLNGTDSIPMQLHLPGFEVYLIGQDGVNLLKPEECSGSEATAPRMAPGNRLEFLIRAPEQPITSRLIAIAQGLNMSRSMPAMRWSEAMGVMMQHPEIQLAEFSVSGAGHGKMPIPDSLPVPAREYPLIREEEIRARRTIALTMRDKSRRILTGFEFLINNQLYEETTVSANPKLGTAEEWTIDNNSDGIHPLHVHVNSFEVISAPWDHAYHRIHDTIWVPPFSKLKIRMRFKTWKGKSVYHCHILPHEDTAMIQNFLIS